MKDFTMIWFILFVYFIGMLLGIHIERGRTK